MERGKYWITVMQAIGHPEKTIGTLQVVSFLVFLPENISWVHFMHLYAPCDVIIIKTTPPMVEHNPSYIVSNSKANWMDGSRDTAIFVSYPSPAFPNLTIIST